MKTSGLPSPRGDAGKFTGPIDTHAGDQVLVPRHGRGHGPSHQPEDTIHEGRLDLLTNAGPHLFTGRGRSLGNPAQRLSDRVRARPIRVRPKRAVTRDRAIDQGRVDLLRIFVAKAVLLSGAGLEVLAEDIRRLDELLKDRPALIGL